MQNKKGTQNQAQLGNTLKDFEDEFLQLGRQNTVQKKEGESIQLYQEGNRGPKPFQ